MVVFGGSNNEGVFQAGVHFLNLGEKKWVTVPLSQDGPTGRHFHSCILYERSLWVFGGSSNGIHQDLFRFNLDSNHWSGVACLGTMPSPRHGHSAVVYNDCMYVYGGYDRMGFVCNDLYEFCFATLSWDRPAQGSNAKEAFHHSAVVYQGSMYTFGGYRKSYNEIQEYRFATKTWSFLHTVGTPPKPRWGHAAVVSGNCMYVFGGRDRVSHFQDLYCFSFDTRMWHRVECDGIDGRFFCSGVVHDSWLYVFGGRNVHNFSFHDTWKVSLKEATEDRRDDSIVDDMQALVGDVEFADMVFVTPDDMAPDDEVQPVSKIVQVPDEWSKCRRVFAHRCIISARSSALDVMLKANMREGITGVVAMRGTSCKAVYAFIVYLYTDTVVPGLELEHLMSLLGLADQWQLFHLKQLCQERMSQYISLENAVKLFVKAQELDAQVLFEACRMFIHKNSRLLPEIAMLSPVLAATVSAVESPPPTRRR